MKHFLTARDLQLAIDAVSAMILVNIKRKNELKSFDSFYYIPKEGDSDYLRRLSLLEEIFLEKKLSSNGEIERLKLRESVLSPILKDIELERITLNIKNLKRLKKELRNSLALCRSVFDDRKIIRNLKNNITLFDDEEDTSFDQVKINLLTDQNLNFNVAKKYKKCA